jgi:DNA replication protein DnaC
MMQDQLRQMSHNLRLFGVHGGFEKRAQQAGAESLNHLEFLRLILEDEFNQRKNAAAKRLLTKAKFRSVADLEDWDQTFERGFTKTKLRELAAIGFFQNQENLLLLGKTGAGKTHLAIAIGRRLCAENVSTLFFPVNFLFEEILAAKASGKYLNFVKKISGSQVLILDDFGLRNYSHDEANVLVDILEDRHRKGSVVVTSQVDPNGWLKLFEDPVIAEAIVSRLEHPSQKIIISGGNYREKLQNKVLPGKKLELNKKLN